RKCLDDRVREVLPRRREQRRVSGTEELEHLAARERPEEARVAEPLERRSIRTVAGDEQRNICAPRGLDADIERLLRRQPARECERRSVDAQLPSQLLAWAQRRQRRRRVRQHGRTLRT